MIDKSIIGIMGPGKGATDADIEIAFQLGKELAQHKHVILTGGRPEGVMEAAMKGAKAGGGLTIGILPSENGCDQSDYVDIPIKTGMGSARNNINVLTADVVIAVGLGAGTTSEITLALKAEKPVFLLNWTNKNKVFIDSLGNFDVTYCESIGQILNILEPS